MQQLPVGSIADEQIFLIGRPPITEFLGYVETQTIEGKTLGRGAAANAWR